MKRFLQRLLSRRIQRWSDKYTSKPNKERVHAALTKLFQAILSKEEKKGIVLPLNESTDKYIIFSDQHKGIKDGSDDFRNCETNYAAALEYYLKEGFSFISLGDEEELWENSIWTLPPKNKLTNEIEKRFYDLKRYYKVFGNHDVFWNNDPLAPFHLKRMFGASFPVYEGLILQMQYNNAPFNIFLTHGHQGDGQSDGNKFSAWFISNIWAPLQSYLELNTNTPATNNHLKTLHNIFMYEWSSMQKNILLVTGHTHQPVFKSRTELESLYTQLLMSRMKKDTEKEKELEDMLKKEKQELDHISEEYLSLKPAYFNSGCCCFSDGDITGIEIAEEKIRLIKWEYDKNNESQRVVLEESSLSEIIAAI